MSLVRAVGVAVASLLAGCSLLTGAADLEVGEPADAPDTSARPVLEASLPPREDAGGADGSAPDVAAGDADANTRIRNVTFENASLTGALGADTKLGSPALVTANNVIDGKYTAALGQSDGLEIAFATAVSEVFVTFVMNLNAVGTDTPVFFRLGSTASAPGTSPLDLALEPASGKAILARIGPVSFGPAGTIEPGTTYRIGVHVQTIGTLYNVEVFLAPKGQAFAGAIINGSSSAGGGAKLTYLRVGAFLGGNLQCYLDDLYVDTASMPPP